ncbi:MAG: 23S rRNA (adenine(2503)-C(2))-methyltransferase RlmN [Chloroflexi bacterium]|nr:23S rRNA (adenine(2503)-C(2))-methyltransferase RlmN [Chloroflexota bacterium]
MPAPTPPVLSALSPRDAESWAAAQGLPPYRGRQLHRALAKRGLQDVRDLTEFPLELRQRLAGQYRTRSIDVRVHLRSRRDAAEKVLFGLHDGATVESVLIPSGHAGKRRQTVCVSSQVGCPAGCAFCATGLGGFGRNLTDAEIADQVMYFAHQLQERGRAVTNVVFMGMGEPLLNTAAVRGAIGRLTDPAGFGLGERHITVSTVGIIPQLRTFADWAGQVNLAVSLHAPNDELRSRLVPYNRHFPIKDLLAAVEDYVARTNRRVSFEYVLLHDVNDAPSLARELADLLARFGGMAHVNLIPWNPFREGTFRRSEGPDADAFASALHRRGVNATVRYSKGLDISAACGQLREQL